jgi:hypothetical protein
MTISRWRLFDRFLSFGNFSFHEEYFTFFEQFRFLVDEREEN